ncbi:MAG: recombination mediator RecR [Candidatus Gracilibacteria bacterium]|nr:recombination mediator RecR [Candidatus Gracilibacteria bacterium]
MPEALKKLINSISYLPGIGEKSATKLAFFLLNSNKNYIDNLSENLKNIKDKVGKCSVCNTLTDIGSETCSICSNPSRNKYEITIVEEYLDMITLEETGVFSGVYHVLGGAISPISGVFVGDLNFEGLFNRIEALDNKVELILATNPNIEGEATANYLIEEIDKRGLKYKVKITRLSRGLSSGYIEYADNMTLINALKERKEI